MKSWVALPEERQAVITPIGFDHLVINTGDVEQSLEFYVGVLGLKPERVEQWRAGEVSFPSVRIDSTSILDLTDGQQTGTNIDHFCLVVDAESIDSAVDDTSITLVDGPAKRWGAQGEATSVYLRDPDGNLVELRSYV